MTTARDLMEACDIMNDWQQEQGRKALEKYFARLPKSKLVLHSIKREPGYMEKLIRGIEGESQP